MKQHVATMRETYEENDLWFDTETKQFTLIERSWGLIDDDLCEDGQKVISAYEALAELVKFNQLQAVLAFREELQIEKNLDRVIANAVRGDWRGVMKLEADMRDEYYILSENEFVRYSSRFYFYVQNEEPAVIDPTVVRRILKNPRTVLRSTYDRRQECWVRAPLLA